MVTFAKQNVILDPPFTKLDILSCRNLLIYLEPELQKKLLPLFHYSLCPGGILFLGSAESIGNLTDQFAVLDHRSRLYRRAGSAQSQALVDFPTKVFPVISPGPEDGNSVSRPAKLQTLAEKLLLERFTPPAVLVNDKGDILYISGRTGKYLEPAAGRVNWNIHAMAREGLRHRLSQALAQALRDKATVNCEGLRLVGNGQTQGLSLTVAAIDEPKDLRGTAMVASMSGPSRCGKARPA